MSSQFDKVGGKQQRRSFRPQARGGWAPPEPKQFQDGGWKKPRPRVEPLKASKAMLHRENIEHTRGRALQRLWRRACDEVLIRHPDPGTTVELEVVRYTSPWTGTAEIAINAVMQGLRDTCYPDRRMSGFLHTGIVRSWPGHEAARVYLAGLWVSYMIHESLEMVTTSSACGNVRTPFGRNLGHLNGCQCDRCRNLGHLNGCQCDRCRVIVVNPHGYDNRENGYHGTSNDNQAKLCDLMRGDSVRLGVEIAVGKSQAEALLSRVADRARLDLENEIRAIEEGLE